MYNMIVTEITAQKKRKNRCNLYIDGEFYSGLDQIALFKAGLKVGKEVSKEELEQVVFESEKSSAFEKIANLVSKQLYSERDLRNKLKNYGYQDAPIDGAIALAKEYRYISDKEYARALVESKPLKSRLELKNALFQKGICSSFAENALSAVSEEDEFSRAEILAEKYLKNKEKNQKTFASLYNFLLRKGFSSSQIKKVLAKYKFEFEE